MLLVSRGACLSSMSAAPTPVARESRCLVPAGTLHLLLSRMMLVSRGVCLPSTSAALAQGGGARGHSTSAALAHDDRE
jgi:hypothetical protein